MQTPLSTAEAYIQLQQFTVGAASSAFMPLGSIRNALLVPAVVLGLSGTVTNSTALLRGSAVLQLWIRPNEVPKSLPMIWHAAAAYVILVTRCQAV
jgi:hypothetical protein